MLTAFHPKEEIAKCRLIVVKYCLPLELYLSIFVLFLLISAVTV